MPIKKLISNQMVKVWDMYSDVPSGIPPYQFTFITHQCGNYAIEGDCYNREHSWPQSWFIRLQDLYPIYFMYIQQYGKVNEKKK